MVFSSILLPLFPGVMFRMAQQRVTVVEPFPVMCHFCFLCPSWRPAYVVVSGQDYFKIHLVCRRMLLLLLLFLNWKQKKYVFKNTHICDVRTRPESRGKTHNSYRETWRRVIKIQKSSSRIADIRTSVLHRRMSLVSPQKLGSTSKLLYNSERISHDPLGNHMTKVSGQYRQI